MQRPKRTSLLAWIRLHKIVFVLVLLALGALGLFVYNKIALYQNKRAFQQARNSIDMVYADIVQQIGQPDSFEQKNNCTRSYQEFTGLGPITCHIDTIFIYGVIDKDDANSIYKKIQEVIHSDRNLLKSTKPLSSGISDQYIVDTNYHTASDTYRSHGLNCVANYIFDTPKETSLKLSDDAKKSLEVTLACYGPAKQAIYRLAY